MRTRSLVLALALLAFASPATAQRGGIAGRITSAETGERLAHSVVAIAALDREQFTSDSGTFLFTGVPAGRHELLVRRLGFQPTTVILHVRENATDSVTIALQRVVVVLEEVTVRTWPACRTPGMPGPGADSTLAAIFQQVRLNAEQFRLLSRSYPFEYTVERTMINRMRADGTLKLFWRDLQAYRSQDKWDYEPGEVVVRRGRTWSLRIPDIAVLADRKFVASHCFHYAGRDKVDSVEMVRVDFVASEAIEKPDVNGEMYLDPQTYQIRRTVLYPSRRTDRLKHIIDMRVTTDFGEYLPSIPIIVQIMSVQVIDPLVQSDLDEAHEEQRLLHFAFRGRTPGGG